MRFTDPFDQALAEHGPAALFTLTHQGELQIDVMRTRELRRQNSPPFPIEKCHCLVIDSATKWPQYALITSSKMCSNFERGVIQICSSYDDAIKKVSEAKAEFYSKNS